MKIKPPKQKDVGDVPIINTPPIEVDFPREPTENPFDCGREVMDVKIGNDKIAFCCNKHAKQFWKEWSYQYRSQLNKTGGKKQNKV